MQLVLPILPHFIHGLLHNVLYLFVRCFSLTVCLGMVWRCNIVLNSMFGQELPKGLVDEV